MNSRTVWLSIFLALVVLGTAAHILGVLTPSWQFVYLEDGRTEHHHGLWLDCKRDYSNEYGRPREYYERIHRLDYLQTPFDQFWLPVLQCVFKFDYWLDEEDWYEHGYDENQLQGDAYQHLFIGWKIGAFASHLFGAICALVAIVFAIYGYCHRLCVCVAAVLVTFNVISVFIGNGIFYAFASLQDNNIIKSEDGLLYEQHFGWSFWSSLIGNSLMFLASVTGCVATRAAFAKEKTRFIKINFDKFDDDNTELLRTTATSTTSSVPPELQTMPLKHTPANFRRSGSNVYKIDADELRQFERDPVRRTMFTRRQKPPHFQAVPPSVETFKRTNSMPNIRKPPLNGIQKPQLLIPFSAARMSSSDLSKALTDEPTHQFYPRRTPSNNFTHDKHAKFQVSKSYEQPVVSFSDSVTGKEVLYEYVDQKSLSLNTTLDGGLKSPKSTRLNCYDQVPMSADNIDDESKKNPSYSTKINANMASTSFDATVLTTDDQQQYYLQPKDTYFGSDNTLLRQHEFANHKAPKTFDLHELKEVMHKRGVSEDYKRTEPSTKFESESKDAPREFNPLAQSKLDMQEHLLLQEKLPLPSRLFVKNRPSPTRLVDKQSYSPIKTDLNAYNIACETTKPSFTEIQINTFQQPSDNGSSNGSSSRPVDIRPNNNRLLHATENRWNAFNGCESTFNSDSTKTTAKSVKLMPRQTNLGMFDSASLYQQQHLQRPGNTGKQSLSEKDRSLASSVASSVAVPSTNFSSPDRDNNFYTSAKNSTLEGIKKPIRPSEEDHTSV